MSPVANRICSICHQQGGKLCVGCFAIAYCGKDCQRKDWSTHKYYCKFYQNFPLSSEPQKIQCVKIKAAHFGYENVAVLSTHPIFRHRPLPISTKCGYPLVMARLVENLPRGPKTDNQHATWFNIDPQSGFAPPEWQGGIGDIIVASADGKPLSLDVLAAYLDYVSIIMDSFGEGGGPPTHKYDRAKLDRYIKQHLQGNY